MALFWSTLKYEAEIILIYHACDFDQFCVGGQEKILFWDFRDIFKITLSVVIDGSFKICQQHIKSYQMNQFQIARFEFSSNSLVQAV